MEKTKEQIKDFILKTLLPYREDKNNCGRIEDGACMYLTPDGKKCAVGRWMKEGEWQNYDFAVGMLSDKYNLEDILLEPAKDMKFSVGDWKAIQEYHDSVGLDGSKDYINSKVSILEEKFDVNLTELRF